MKFIEFLKISSIGAIQFGLMYSFFQGAFFFLNGHEIALLMVSTPIYVVLIDNSMAKNWNAPSLILATVAVLAVAALSDFSQKFCFQWQGVLLTQACNFSFALGQILVKRFCETRNIGNVFHLNSALYAGATVVCIPLAIISANYFSHAPMAPHTLIHAVLFGVVCCGICHWLWNMGAIRTHTRILAAMNNLQIPLSIVISCAAFGEKVNGPRFIGSAVILAIAFIAMFFARVKPPHR